MAALMTAGLVPGLSGFHYFEGYRNIGSENRFSLLKYCTEYLRLFCRPSTKQISTRVRRDAAAQSLAGIPYNPSSVIDTISRVPTPAIVKGIQLKTVIAGKTQNACAHGIGPLVIETMFNA